MKALYIGVDKNLGFGKQNFVSLPKAIRGFNIVLPPLNGSSPPQCPTNRINLAQNGSYSVSLNKITTSSQTTTHLRLASIRCLAQHSCKTV